MRALLFATTGTLGLIGVTSFAQPISEPIVNPANNHVYYLLESAGWQESESMARALGGNLVALDSAEEEAFILSAFANFEGIARNLWIGYNDIEEEGEWVWSNGQPVTYTNWASGEPNNVGNEDAAHTWIREGGRWNDSPIANTGNNEGPFHGVVEVLPITNWILGPFPSVVPVNGTAQFGVLPVDDELDLEFQWLFNGSPIPGATQDTLRIDFVRFTDQGEYSVEVTNGAVTLVSDAVRLAVVEFELSIATAVEIEFPTSVGKTYTIQSSEDLVNWLPMDGFEALEGTGQLISVLLSTKSIPNHVFRVVEIQ